MVRETYVQALDTVALSSPKESEDLATITEKTGVRSSPKKGRASHLSALLDRQKRLQQDLSEGTKSWEVDVSSLEQSSANLKASTGEIESILATKESPNQLKEIVQKNMQLEQQLVVQNECVNSRKAELQEIERELSLVAREVKSICLQHGIRIIGTDAPAKPVFTIVWELSRQVRKDNIEVTPNETGNPQDQQPSTSLSVDTSLDPNNPFEQSWNDVLKSTTLERTVYHLAGLLNSPSQQQATTDVSGSPDGKGNKLESIIEGPGTAPSNRISQTPVKVQICCQGNLIQEHVACYSGPLLDDSNDRRLPHGNGSLWFANGDWYLGEFVHGQLHGNGTFTRRQRGKAKVYRGRFLQNQFVRKISAKSKSKKKMIVV